MARTKKIAPPHSVILVADAEGGEIPQSMHGAVVSATSSCLAIGCLAEVDGETTITLAPLSEIDRANPPVFVGILRTPTRVVVVSSVLGEQLLRLQVSGEAATVKVWANDDSEPDEVVVGAE